MPQKSFLCRDRKSRSPGISWGADRHWGCGFPRYSCDRHSHLYSFTPLFYLSPPMDYLTAYNFLMDRGTALVTQRNPDDLLCRLQQGKPPIPGQLTAILLALKVVFDGLQDAKALDRELVWALYLLSSESQQFFEMGRRSGVSWPPLLKEDLHRIAIAVQSIYSGVWQLS